MLETFDSDRVSRGETSEWVSKCKCVLVQDQDHVGMPYMWYAIIIIINLSDFSLSMFLFYF